MAVSACPGRRDLATKSTLTAPKLTCLVRDMTPESLLEKDEKACLEWNLPGEIMTTKIYKRCLGGSELKEGEFLLGSYSDGFVITHLQLMLEACYNRIEKRRFWLVS